MESIKNLLKTTNSDKQSGHRYGFLYDLLFSKVYSEKKEKLKVLEIGVSEYGDGSLRAYAQSEMVAKAIGIDIKDYTGELLDNMAFYKLDAYSHASMKTIEQAEGLFDIIIDDGSHSYEHQTFFLNNYWGLLNDGGFLICEDVNFLQVITEQCEKDNVFFIDGWGNLELGLQSFTDPKLYQHNERLIIKTRSEPLTDYATHDSKPHIAKLPVRKFRDYPRSSTELAISVPLFHPDFPDPEMYNAQKFRDVHVKGAIWAAMSMIHNSDLGERGVPVYFHIEDKVWNDAFPVFQEFGVPQDWCRKMVLPEPTVPLTAVKAQFGKKLMALIDGDIDADVTMVLDSDLFTCVTGGRFRLYDKLTLPILKRQPAMTYFQRRDLEYWWWVSVVMGSAPLNVDLINKEQLNKIEQMGYERLGFEKELEQCNPNDKVNRYFAEDYLITFPRQHPARDFGVKLIPQCYTPPYAFSMWAEFNHPIIELDKILGIPVYDWEKDFIDAQRGENCFAHIRVSSGRSDKFPMPSLINQYWDTFLENVSRHIS